MKPISKLRFDSLAGYSRAPEFPLIVHELGWFEEGDERVLGVLAVDISDNDYDCFVLGRDRKDRFRAIWFNHSIPTHEQAYSRLAVKIAEFARMPSEAFYQDDEVGRPLDFFTPVVKSESLHRGFSILISNRGSSSARGLLGELMHYFEDADGNFVQQFQTTGFNSRIWELYLYALFTELGYAFDHTHAAPDFHCTGLRGEFFVEATTVNPSAELPAVDKSKRQEYFEHYVTTKRPRALLEAHQDTSQEEILGASARGGSPARHRDPRFSRAAVNELE